MIAKNPVEPTINFSPLTSALRTVLKGEVFDTSPWDGSSSNWGSAGSYCASCLIDVNPSGQEKVKELCKLPVRKEGSDKVNKNAVRTLAGGRGVSAVKKPEGVSGDAWNKSVASAKRRARRLWKMAFNTDIPASLKTRNGLKSSFELVKGKSGEWWVLGIYSNKFLDRDQEIIPESAHIEYAKWVQETGFKPVITILHQPTMPSHFWQHIFDRYGNDIPVLNKIVRQVYKDFGIAEVQRILPVNGFVAYAAKVFSDKRDIAEKLAQVGDLGMSHGFVLLQKDANVLAKYRSFELSYLPRRVAANIFTRAIVGDSRMDEKGKLSADNRQFLVDLFGEEVVSDLEVETERKQSALENLLDFKAVLDSDTETEDEAQEDEESVEEEEDTMEEEKKDATLETTEASVQEPASEAVVVEPQEEAVPDTADVVADEVGEEVVEEKSVETEPELSYEEIRAKIIEDLAITDLVEVIKELKQTNEELRAKLDGLEGLKGQVEEISKSQDEKIAELYAPPQWHDPGFSPTKSKANTVTSEKASVIAKEGPASGKTLNTDSIVDMMLFKPMAEGKIPPVKG